jgi:hypothetical protein
MHPLPGAVSAPLAEVVVAGVPGWQVMRHHVPGAAGSQHVEDAVDELAIAVFSWASGSTLSLGLGQEGLDDGPLLIGQVGGIAAAFHATSLPYDFF